MDRRRFLIGAAAVTVTGSAGAAADGGTGSPGAANRLVDLASDCVRIGELCEAHCFQQLQAGDTSMARCAQSVNLMLATCRALVVAAAQSSPRLKEIARACGQVCRDCEAACKPHSGHHEICRKCMDACRACATECERVSA